jgi:CBS domain-containing protein
LTVEDVMTKPVATCRLDRNLAEATALMWENDCGALPVLNEAGELAGIVTDRDLCIALGTRNARPSELCVRDVFKDYPLVCESSDDIHTALRTMGEGKVRRLPVVNDEAVLEGIISMDDLILNVENEGKLGSVMSLRDVVTTLQAIYTRHDQFHELPAAA